MAASARDTDSESDTSDSPFEPSPSPVSSPRQEFSAQAQYRIGQNLNRPSRGSAPPQSRSRGNASIRSTRQHQSSPRSPLKRTSSQMETSQEQQQPPSHHPGPFTSSPTPEVPPLPQISQSHSESRSVTRSLSPSPSHQDPRTSQSQHQHLSLRPNRFLGAPSTYRSWTEEERTILTSLQRIRAQDLSIHLYNAFMLRKKAEAAGNRGRGSRSRSRSTARQPNQRQSKSRQVSQTRDTKGKGKARAESASRVSDDDGDDSDTDSNEDEESAPRTRSRPRANPQTKTTTTINQEEDITFNPPRLWTAWPLPPDQVPREHFLPLNVLTPTPAATSGGYRCAADPRPSAELEACLIAVTARIARAKWEAREWADPADDDKRKRSKRRKKGMKKEEGDRGSQPSQREETLRLNVDNESGQMLTSSAQAQQLHHFTSSTSGPSPDPPSPSPSSSSSSSDPDIPHFTSQIFTAAPSSSSSSSASTTSKSLSQSTDSTSKRPTFLADDETLHHLLLPSTRHIMTQFDSLLTGLHKMQHYRKRKRVDVAGMGAKEVLGLAGVWFGDGVVERARARCVELLGEGEV